MQLFLFVTFFVFKGFILTTLKALDSSLDINVIDSHDLKRIAFLYLITIIAIKKSFLLTSKVELVLMLKFFLCLQLLLELGKGLSFLLGRYF
jgi:hypothetical protein